MPGGWNGSGTFTRYYGTDTWQNDAAAGTLILADRHDNNDQGLATGINACLTKNGENTFTGSSGAFRASVDNSVNLGSTALRWQSAYLGTSLVFQGASFATTVTAAPTANRAIVVPDKAGTLALTEQYLVTAFSANTGTTTVPFLPSGLSTNAWAEICVIFDAVSISGTDNILLQLIDTGGNITSGYFSRAVTFNGAGSQTSGSSSGFIIPAGSASAAFSGHLTLRREAVAAIPGGDTWTINGGMPNSVGSNGSIITMGNGALGSGTPTRKLDGLRLITTGANTFDAGTIYVTGRI